MQMTNEEIIRNYRQAKSKKEQIKILADLNQVSRKEIESVLIEGGLLVEHQPRRKRTIWAEEQEKDLIRFRKEGLTDTEIAERLGLDAVAVKNKVTRLGLRQSGRQKKSRSDSNEMFVDADQLYISQLEELMRERNKEMEYLREENKSLSEQCISLKEQALTDMADEKSFEVFKEIYAIADCLVAVDYKNLIDISSVICLLCRIIEIIDNNSIQKKE